jgi:hypothetical protein
MVISSYVQNCALLLPASLVVPLPIMLYGFSSFGYIPFLAKIDNF